MVNMYPELDNIQLFGSEYINVVKQNIHNPFWRDVVQHFKLLFSKYNITKEDEFYAEHIQYNSNIVRGKKSVYLKSWHDCGIFYIWQLLNGDGNYLRYEEFLTKFPGVSTNFLVYEGIILAIKNYQKKKGILLIEETGPFEHPVWRIIEKGSKYIQSTLNSNDDTPTSLSKWNSLFDNLEWTNIFLHLYRTTTDPKLKWFQLRLLHRAIPSQKYLFIRKLVDSPLCNFCNQEEQTLCHLFYECNVVKHFWNVVLNNILDKCQHCHNLQLRKQLIMFGLMKTVSTDRVLDFIIIMAKYFIYVCKLKDVQPVANTFMLLLHKRYKVEHYAASIIGKSMQFKLDWTPYLHLFN
jgi:hypothetical protein